jgi:hypothetical protein
VNDPPTFRLGASPFIAANPGTFTYNGFGRNISQGANEDSAPLDQQFTLQFAITSCTNPSMFPSDGFPTMSPVGNLNFKLTQNTAGIERSSRCNVQLQEGGGLSSTTQFMTIIRK